MQIIDKYLIWSGLQTSVAVYIFKRKSDPKCFPTFFSLLFLKMFIPDLKWNSLTFHWPRKIFFRPFLSLLKTWFKTSEIYKVFNTWSQLAEMAFLCRENIWERAPSVPNFQVTLKNKIKLHNMANSRPKYKPLNPYCCGASVASEQQHYQDLRRIHKRKYEFSNSSLFTRLHCRNAFW